MNKILVVEDSDSTVHQLKRSLERNGYEVYIAYRGREALEIISKHRIDLVLLDLGLPDISGLSVCNELRAQYPLLPIIIISVKTDLREKVNALNSCADDYVSKPFDMPEVLARIKVQFLHGKRMRAGAEKKGFTAGPLTIHYEQRRITVNGEEVDLTYTEYELLYVLVQHRGKIVTYDIISSHVWDDNDISERKNIHVYINRLRKKIETPAQRRFIYNEAKVGYRFQADD